MTKTPALRQIEAIASDVVSSLKRNPHNYTAETLIDNWKERIAWRGLKVGGKAWQTALFETARSGWIAATQNTSVFIPPSPETLSWGGFLGGEYVSTHAMVENAEAAFARKFGVTC